MNVPKYHLKAESEFTRFEFTSEGKKGAIRKLIEFQSTTDPEVYNLAFGDKDTSTGEMDDLAVSDNGDTEKVLATVIDALYVFFDKHPHFVRLCHGKHQSTDAIVQDRYYKIP